MSKAKGKPSEPAPCLSAAQQRLAPPGTARRLTQQLVATSSAIARQLPLRTPIAKGESLGGYVHRLAERNNCSGLWLWHGLGSRKHLGFRQLERLSVLSGIPADELDEHCWHTLDEREAENHVWMVAEQAANRDLSRVCLSCLREGAPHLQLFELRPIRFCPKHLTLLTDQCPVCARKLRWRRRRFSLCPAGHDLKRFRPAGVQPTEAELALVRALFKSGGHQDVGTPTSDLYRSHFSSFSAWDLIYLCQLILGVIDRNAKSKVRSLLSMPSGERLAVAFAHLERWPEALFPSLDRLRNDKTRHLALFNTRTRNWLATTVGNPKSRKAVAAFNRALDAYAHWRGFPLGWRLRSADPASDLITLSSASALVGQSNAKILEFAALNGWKVVKHGSTARLWVSKRDVDGLIRNLKQRVEPKAVGKQLGLQRIPLKRLAQEGAFGEPAKTRASLAGSHWYLLQSEVTDFKQSMTHSVNVRRCSDPWILEDCHHLHFLAGVTHVDLILAVCRGHLRPVRWPKLDLKSLTFSVSDLRAFADGHFAKAKDPDLLSLKMAAAEFDCTTLTIRAALTYGLMRVAEHKRSGFWIHREEFARFRRSYTTTRWLAAKAKLSAYQVCQRLLVAGVRPVGPHGSIYRLQEVHDAGFA